MLNDCTLNGNSANLAGGAYISTLNNCLLSDNSTYDSGGGAYASTLNNCTLSGNSASSRGGGASEGTLNNCTLSGNSASEGGGAYYSTLNNCIVYYNTAPNGPNFVQSEWGSINYSCATPVPTNGVGNISLDPQLASASHLSAGSPCRGAGSAACATGTDIDGEPWANPPSMGCDENHPGSVTGAVSVAAQASHTTVLVGFRVELQALISGRVSASRWEFGDGTVVSNRPYASHAWSTTGDYPVILRAYNESYPGGVTATVTVHVVTQPVHYVALDNPAPAVPYSSWATAATNIQDAVDAASVPGALVLVSNGVYQAGGWAVYGTMTNRVAVTKFVTVRSVNGPGLTVIRGYRPPGAPSGDSAVRCVYLTSGASLSGFTLTNGAARASGDPNQERSAGGVWCESANAIVSNCVISGNSAYYGAGAYCGTLNDCTLTNNSAQAGGGVSWATLNNCILSGNWAYDNGGGAFYSTLNNCTLKNNAADAGGGAYYGTLNNCTLTSNSPSYRAYYGGGVYGSTLYNCTLTGNEAIHGGGAYRGTLNNCTITGNEASSGGGACVSIVNNCVLTGNRAGSGGGVDGGALSNCTLIGNSALDKGGGAYGGTLHNCTLTGNSTTYGGGGGANGGTLINCIVYDNTAPFQTNYTDSTLNYCCTTPLPDNGPGNITTPPLFVDYANGNLRLQSNSPCINAGLNAYAPAGPDLDGLPRIVSGTVDIGAYEYQGAGSVISYAWLQQYGLPTDGSADYADPDHEGMNNWQEWICGTCPTNPLSALRLLAAPPAGTNVSVTWESVAGVSYFLERSANLGSPFTLVATDILGQAGTTTYADTNAANQARLFYRVGVTN
jgi:hypothetical protein